MFNFKRVSDKKEVVSNERDCVKLNSKSSNRKRTGKKQCPFRSTHVRVD